MTQEMKARYFAGYYNQKVLRVSKDAIVTQTIDGYFLTKIYVNSYLELTPLTSITDEDAVEVAKIVMRRHDRHYNKVDYTIHERSTKEFFYIEILVKAENTHRGYLVRIESTDVHISDEVIKSGDNYTDRGKDYSTTNSFHAYQYLQSRGYALPFMEYSVEHLIEMGWLKLKNN